MRVIPGNPPVQTCREILPKKTLLADINANNCNQQ
jgi:hypothetical protein